MNEVKLRSDAILDKTKNEETDPKISKHEKTNYFSNHVNETIENKLRQKTAKQNKTKQNKTNNRNQLHRKTVNIIYKNSSVMFGTDQIFHRVVFVQASNECIMYVS